MNKPNMSKINWTAALALLASLTVAFGVVPAEHEKLALQTVGTLSPILIMVFRTWFTDKT